MNSSTFSSNSEWKVLLTVLLTLLVCEFAVGVRARKYLDVQHHDAIPSLCMTLEEKPSPRVLFLGNSLTKAGIRIDDFADELRQRGKRLGGVGMIRPDDTTLRHWHYLFENNFGRQDREKPDLVIVTFVGNHLTDQVAPRLRRLAMNTEARQVFDVLCHDVGSINDAGYFLAVHSLDSLAHQPDIKGGVLRLIVPGYESETQRLNHVRQNAQVQGKSKSESDEDQREYTYNTLSEFIELLKSHHSHGVFCLMPLPGEQTVDPLLVETIESAHMTFLDFRHLAAQTAGHYPDGYHMDSVAASIYTRAVAGAVAAKLE